VTERTKRAQVGDSKTLLDQLMDDSEFERLAFQEEYILDVTEQIVEAMGHAGMNKSQLAEKLGKTRASVTQFLNGSRNLTCRTIADISYALGRKPLFKMQVPGATASDGTEASVVMSNVLECQNLVVHWMIPEGSSSGLLGGSEEWWSKVGSGVPPALLGRHTDKENPYIC